MDLFITIYFAHGAVFTSRFEITIHKPLTFDAPETIPT